MTNGMISISPSSTSLTYVVIFQLHLHMAYIYRSLFHMQDFARHTISFWFEAVYWQISWCHRGFNCLDYRQFSANVMVVTTFLWTNAIWYISYQSLSCSWQTDLDYGLYRLSNVEIGLTAGATGQQGMLTRPWHLIPPLIYSDVRVRPFSDFYFLYDFWNWLLFVIFVISKIDRHCIVY
jgi:hypothetical protein